MFIYSYQQHDHLLPGNDRMLVIGSSALAKNHGHLKSSRLAADTLIFNFPLNHPRLWRQMEHSLSGARYSIIPNKVSAISVDDFRKNYMAFVSQLSKRCRFLILATSTSIMDGPDGTLNEEKEKTLAAFNAIVREAASSLPGAVLSDHHGFMQGRRYIDPFHFSPPDRAYQAGKTAGLLLPLLSARQEPPKEQECPKTRPEP